MEADKLSAERLGEADRRLMRLQVIVGHFRESLAGTKPPPPEAVGSLVQAELSLLRAFWRTFGRHPDV